MAKLSRETQVSLIESAILGDEQAFAAIHQAYDKLVRGTLRTYLSKNQDVVEDLSQAVWLSVHKHLPGFRGESDFYTWITRIAINEALCFIRSNKLAANSVSLAEPIGEDGKVQRELVCPNTTLENLEMQSNLARIRLLTESLPAHYRATMRLRLQGEKFEDIAAKLDIPTGTVKSQYQRATKLLAGMMGV